MNKGIVNQPLLEKDISLITLYSENENKCISKMASEYEEFCDGYSSSNTSLLIGEMNDVNNINKKIKEKRDHYPAVLNRVINQYISISEKVKKTAKETKV